jgi:CubicO group peptidase (beta-lactamase class C family)
MLRRSFITHAAGIGLAATTAPPLAQGAHTPLGPLLQPYLARFTLPALAAAVVKQGQTIAAGAVGTRRIGADIPVTVNDRFHIGSDTKAMTSLLAGMLVEAGKLRWDTTVGDAYPELVSNMDQRLADVTLVQLLSHTSGMPGDNDAFMNLVNQSFAQDDLNLDELRYWLVRQWIPRPLEAAPGTRFAYSNMGYTLAGSIIERAGGKTWEELVTQRIFAPLGLSTAGFGPQANIGRVDAPLGHATLPDGTLKPMLAGPDGDSPAILGPAGTVHLSVLDFAAWASWNAGEGRRGPPLVRPETIRKLHTEIISMEPRPDAAPGTPSGVGYALGWGLAKLPHVSEPLLQHAGSNTMNLASIVLQPSRDFGMVLMTNVGRQKADQALLQLTEELYKAYGPAPG